MTEPERLGEYRSRGDYHRDLDPDWSYAPIYSRKVELVDRFVFKLPATVRLLDVGAGEGSLVDRYRSRGYDCLGVDAYYGSEHVRQADLLSLPFPKSSFDAVLCLDVLEHLNLLDQPDALREIKRVLVKRGVLLLSLPNLAHLHSRLSFFTRGRLTRTSALERHPGDRPIGEYLQLLETTGFRIAKREGIFPTVPLIFKLVNRHPARFGWMVSFSSRLLPLPGLCFLNVIEAHRVDSSG